METAAASGAPCEQEEGPGMSCPSAVGADPCLEGTVQEEAQGGSRPPAVQLAIAVGPTWRCVSRSWEARQRPSHVEPTLEPLSLPVPGVAVKYERAAASSSGGGGSLCKLLGLGGEDYGCAYFRE